MDIVGLLEPFKPYIVGTIKGFGAGAFAAGLGYLKTVKETSNKLKDFDELKFTRTILLGGIIGALGQGIGVEPETAEDWLAYPFIVYSIEVVTKVVYRRIVGPVITKLKELFI